MPTVSGKIWRASFFAFLLTFWVFVGGQTALASAAEAPPELLWQVPADVQPGSGAGRMDAPRGLAVNPTTGNVLVADFSNARLDEFTVWGEFVKAWGFGVRPGSPDTELQTCTAETGCEQGVAGDAPGQLREPGGIAVDSAGSVYVYELGNSRVTKYDEDGEFVLTFAGTFENTTVGNFIAVGPTGTIFVGDKGRIQEFNPDGSVQAEIPFAGELAALADDTVFNLAIDPLSGDLYFDTTADDNLYRVSATGVLRGTVKGSATVDGAPKSFPANPAALAVDAAGSLWVVDRPAGDEFGGPFEVLKFSPTGECLVCGVKFVQPDTKTLNGRVPLGLAASSSCAIPGSDLYVTIYKGLSPAPVSYLQSYGPAPQDVVNCPPPPVPPSISDQYATTVGTEDAEVQARINPRFWKDTTYYVQYGPQECLDSGWTTGCSTAPPPPGDLLTDKVTGGAIPTESVALEGLQPDTVYHYRFVTQSSGGGPVFGAAASFRTFPVASPTGTGCPNQPFRTGLSTFLPDCRAFEMVSPIDKNGSGILTQKSIRSHPAELNISALDGNSATFSSQTAFADAVSAPYASQYIARRDPTAGWQTKAISPPREDIFSPAGKAEAFELDNQYKLFSPDLGQSWLMQEADPPLDECGVPGYINWYRRDNATGAYEAVTTKAPPAGKDPVLYLSEVQGVGVDGEGRTHTIYRANDQLTVDSGPPAGSVTGYQLYEHVSDPGGGCGETRLVSVLPGGSANATASSVGTATSGNANYSFIEARENTVHNAVSADGSVIYWSAAGGGTGKIFARVGGAETREVSTAAAHFWFAAADGSMAYYIQGENLFRYTLATQSRTLVAARVIGLLGAGEDASRVYFVSRADLDGGGAAAVDRPNLYLREGATTRFIATLSEGDISANSPETPTNPFPVSHTASVSEDGRFLAFTSDASLTGHDNIDAESGLADMQAFYFEADSGELRCVSCNLTGARPKGRVIAGANNTKQGYAAGIPPWKNQFHAPRVISSDGSTVYFESLERLLARDTNGAQDVYQWRRAEDEATCKAAGAELYNPVAGGCISLVSSGTGDGDASFVDSTPSGSDVFFKTEVSLLAPDPGRVDLYDARVGGGFPEPVAPPRPEPPIPPGPPATTNPNSATGLGNFDPAGCKPLERKAQKLAAKARKARKQAAKAGPAKAKQLRKQAKKQTKQAKRAGARAQSCLTGTKGK